MNISLVNRPISVRVVPVQPHCFAFGGFEYQMLDAMDSVKSDDINIKPLDFWNREADFDILHLWGLDIQHHNTIKWAKLAGKKTLLSILVGYDDWKLPLKKLASHFLYRFKLQKFMLTTVDAISVVNQGQKDFIIKIFGINDKKIFIIPNIVGEEYFKNEADNKPLNINLMNYIICTGNVCNRKNQILLALACKNTKTPLLIVGNCLTGEEKYAEKLEHLIADCNEIIWLKGLNKNSHELLSAYKNSIAFALPSYAETQPISALEAAALGKPLILADKPYSRQEKYTNACLINQNSIQSIASGIIRVRENPKAYIVPKKIIQECNKENIGNLYSTIYRDITNMTPTNSLPNCNIYQW